MKRALSILVFAAALPLAGCPSTVVREETVLKAEVNWFTMAAVKQAELLHHFVTTHPDCVCNAGGAYTNPECGKAARTLLTAMHRAPWHKQMALYNSGLLDERPPQDPPEIPDVRVLCMEDD